MCRGGEDRRLARLRSCKGTPLGTPRLRPAISGLRRILLLLAQTHPSDPPRLTPPPPEPPEPPLLEPKRGVTRPRMALESLPPPPAAPSPLPSPPPPPPPPCTDECYVSLVARVETTCSSSFLRVSNCLQCIFRKRTRTSPTPNFSCAQIYTKKCTFYTSCDRILGKILTKLLFFYIKRHLIDNNQEDTK